MNGISVALAIVAFLASPVNAAGPQAPFHSQAMFHSQGDEHKSEMGELHDKEAWDIEEREDDGDIPEVSPTPTALPSISPSPSPSVSPTPSISPTPTETASPSPLISPTPTATPDLESLDSGILERISDFFKQIIELLQPTNE